MAFLYTARPSFVLLRPKKLNLPTQNCRKVDLCGEIGIQNLSWIDSQKWKGPRRTELFPQWVRYHNHGINRFHQESSPTGEETVHILFAKFSFFVKMTIFWPRTPSFWPSQSSLAPPMLFCWWQTMVHWNRDNKVTSIWRFSGGATKIKYQSRANRQYPPTNLKLF